MQQKSKQHNGAEETELKVAFLKLQADIVESTPWPSKRVELILSLITYMQMFKYGYDYCSSVWTAPYGIPEQVFFSYLDIAHYEKYLPETIYVNLLYVVMGLMGFYLVCFAYLLRPVFEGGFNSLLKKIMKVLMELFSGLLFMPIVRTIVNNQTCQMGVQSAVIPCLNQTNILSVTVVSYVLLGLFSLLLMVQCVVRYQFIRTEQEKIIRNSSRSHCLQLLYILANEFAVLFVNGLATVIVLNTLAVLLLLYSLLADQFVTPTAKKLQLCFLTLNLALVVVTDITFLTVLTVPLFFWVALCPILISTVWLQNSINIRNELDNINKWTTPVDMLRYCAGLRHLVSQADRPRNKMLINGYCDVHRQKCEQPTCPVRMTPAALKKLRTFNPLATRGKPNEVLMIEELIKKIYSQGVKFFPTNSSLELEYAHFLYNKDMKEQALKELLQMDLDDASFDQYYKYHRLKYRIHREISARNTHSCLDMLSELQMNRKEEEFMKLLEKTALVDLQFWGVLNEDHPDFLKLDQIGISRMKLGESVVQLYKSITEIGNSQRTTFLYVLFLINVNKHEQEFNDIYETVKQEYNLNRKITIEDWANSSNCIVLFNGEEEKFGNVADLNLSAASFLGYEKYELLNRNISMLLCPIFEGRINEFLTGKTLEQQQSMLHNEMSQLQSSLAGVSNAQMQQQSSMSYYLFKKNGYCVPVTRRIQVFNSMSRGFIYMCTLEPAKVEQQCFILCNQQGKVQGMSSSCISLLGIDLKFTSFRDTIDSIFPELMGQIEGIIDRPERRLVKHLFSEDVVDKAGIESNILEGEVSLKAERIDESGFVLIFEHVDHEMRNTNYRNNHHTNGQFEMKFSLRTSKAVPTVIGTKHDYSNQPPTTHLTTIDMGEDITNIVLEERNNYGDGIRTVRLYDNEVDVIEQSQNGDKLYQQEKQNILQNQLSLRLSRKHQELIFQNKQKLLEFIDGYETGRLVKVFMLGAAILHLGLFVLVFVLFSQHNNTTVDNFGQILYESRKIGELQTMYSTLESYEQIAGGSTDQTLSQVSAWMDESIRIMQNIKTNGVKAYPLQVIMTDNTTKSFYSDEFIESFLNNALLCNSLYSSATDAATLAAVNSTNAQLSNYFVRNNGMKSYAQMVSQLDAKLVASSDQIQSNIIGESIILASCYVFEVLFTVFAIYLFYSVYNEKIKVLKIFLSIPEHQIMLFSSKSQRFLTSLHVEDNEVEEDEQAFTAERTNRNSFSVKKKFKVIKRQNSVYYRFLLIPLVVQIFYAMSFTTSQSNLSFMKDGMQYANQTSSAKRLFYNGLANMQGHILNHTAAFNPASNYITYYESLFDLHEKTFSYDNDYHSYFIQVMMADICNGSITVADACELDMSTNGTLLIFTDMTVFTAYSNLSADFPIEYYYMTKTIARAHDLLSEKLLTTQASIVNTACRSLMNYFFVFMFGSLAVFMFYGIPLINLYLSKINCTKKMLGLLPLSVAKQSEEIHSYFQEILDKKKFCFN